MPPIPENKLKCVSIYFHPPSLPSGPGWRKPLDQAVLKITYILIIYTNAPTSRRKRGI